MGRIERRMARRAEQDERRRQRAASPDVTRIRRVPTLVGADGKALPAPLLGAPALGATWDRVRSWEPPREWVEQLAELSPVSTQHSWLKLVWLAGDAWEPVERWCLYEMIPEQHVRPDVLAWLRGPNPRTMGHYDRRKGRWVSHGPPISRLQWELFRETRCFGHLWWIIQGSGGGHAYRISPLESAMLEVRTGRADLPAPGDLPYAPFDERVLRWVRERDRLAAFRLMCNYADRSSASFDREDMETLVQVREEVGRWLETQMLQAVEEVGPIAPSDLPSADEVARRLGPMVADDVFMADADDVEESFLTER